MMRKHRWHAVSGAALALALTPAAAQAADLVQTLKDQGQFGELVSALDKAGLTQSLQGEGPFTVFAPTDEAFGRLPEGAIEQLSQGDGQLDQVLKHHVVEGKEVMAKDVLGQETQVGTLSGDQLTVDGTGAMVVLVPTGLRVTQVGDEIFVERDVAAMATPAVMVTTGGQQQPTTSGGSGQQSGSAQSSSASTSGQQQADSTGQAASGSTGGQQQQAATSGSGSDQQQTAETQNPEAAAGAEFTEEERSPAARQSQQGDGASQGQHAATSGSGSGQQQAAASGGSGQPSTSGSDSGQQHTAETQNPEAAAGEQLTQEERSAAAQQGQQGAGAGERQPMEQQQGMLRAAMVVEPDIKADNGVIHAINEVLVPQKIEQQLEQAKGQQGSQQGQQGSSN